jgi:hypothetical protein
LLETGNTYKTKKNKTKTQHNKVSTTTSKQTEKQDTSSPTRCAEILIRKEIFLWGDPSQHINYKLSISIYNTRCTCHCRLCLKLRNQHFELLNFVLHESTRQHGQMLYYYVPNSYILFSNNDCNCCLGMKIVVISLGTTTARLVIDFCLVIVDKE